MHVVIAGSSGFLGSHLREEMVRRGHRVTSLVRRASQAVSETTWDPTRELATSGLSTELVESADVVVNLAGSPTIGNPHSRQWSEALRRSRVTTTHLLAEWIAASDRRPAFVAGNAVGWYGDHGTQPLTEAADSRGHTLMTSVCREWQAAAEPAVAAGTRVCWLRTSPVLDRASGPLRQLIPLFSFALGARLGDGRQIMPMLSLRDWVDATTFVVENDAVRGPVNLAAPQLPTNAEFTRALGKAVGRPAVLAAPAPVLRLAAGRLAPEVLGSVNAIPAKLIDAGFTFRDPDVTTILHAALA